MNSLESGSGSSFHSVLVNYVIGYDSALNAKLVRPTFYLNSDVRYVSGTGAESDPYRIQ